MWLCVCLLGCGLQLTTGCTGTSSPISCSPGESVLLSCKEKTSRDEKIDWHYSKPALKPESPLKDIKRNTDRVQIYENHSLSISELTAEDAGKYWCNTHNYIDLIIMGCLVSENRISEKISRYSGETVLLNCSVKCSGAQYSADQSRWKLPKQREIKPNVNSTDLNQLYQGRAQMYDFRSGNVSLLIVNVTEEDEGSYSCWINENQHKNFSLTIKGCTLSETEVEPKTKYPGESVLLPCSCTDPKTKPKTFTWIHVDSNETEVSKETLHYKGRIHTFQEAIPSNLSLLISNLTEEDQGMYRCTVNGKESINVNLTVTGSVDFSKKPLIVILICLVVLFILGVSACIYWRYNRANRERSRESQVIQRTDEDDVTCSTVVQIKGRKPEERQQEDDVTYSSVVYINSHRARIHINSEDVSMYTSVRTDKQ
ncbi:CD276 antigen homolog isoform X2 [Xyrauchen texanus]|uniref:CD276 antigen homolog isoform X2 n=1 Tax=Xyrauchen texanus TaxID=154827 RepID=UPI002241968B|nr:CD276 antigen homolog isoform X2 [Xyrauchen texanus]